MKKQYLFLILTYSVVVLIGVTLVVMDSFNLNFSLVFGSISQAFHFFFNMFFVVLVILVNGCLKGFDVSYILTGGGPGNATELVATYMYKTAFSMSNFGYGSTLAVFILIESLIAVGIVKLIQKKFSD